MPTIPAKQLHEIARLLLLAAGANGNESEIVANHTIGANLAGHDSHGIIQIPTYIDRMGQGDIIPSAPFEIVKETSTTTVVDGHWGFGYVVSEQAMQITIDKAKSGGIAATTVYSQGHVGRVADYPIMATKSNMIGLMTADSGRSPKSVAPFGGIEPRLGTNPISFAIPSNLEGPLFVDMATSAAAAGKLQVAAARGLPIPEGWLLDRNGNPTTDPNDFYKDGVMLPLGGSEGYKGYGLSSIVEILSGILTGLGFAHSPTGRHNDGCFMVAFDVNAFRPVEEFKTEVTDFANYLKSSRRANGVKSIYYPGELEHLRTQENLRTGLNVEDSTWDRLVSLASGFDIKTSHTELFTT